ncbi:MAG: hypothetical protein JWP66_704 [Naasia sp.]|nr:hypothetical protein [Naasia sp.]
MVGSGARRRFRVDVRFLLGAGLVGASVAGVGGIVAAAERTETVYAADDALLVGDRLTRAELVATPVRLGAAGDRYLRADDVPAAGLVVTRPVGAGELVPRSAVGTDGELAVSPVVLPLQSQPAQAVQQGAIVDVWAAPRTDDGVGPPAVLVSGAQVVRVLDGGGLLAGDSGVEVLVPRDRVARMLQALGDGDAVTVVPAGAGS